MVQPRMCEACPGTCTGPASADGIFRECSHDVVVVDDDHSLELPRVDLPDHLKFGYDHMMEMRQIEDDLRAQGVNGTALHFAAVREHEKRHANDPSFKERQQAARARGEAWAGGSTLPTDADILRAALEAIRDGHNDPRGLAEEVLQKVGT